MANFYIITEIKKDLEKLLFLSFTSKSLAARANSLVLIVVF
jgi:hypothetical protein